LSACTLIGGDLVAIDGSKFAAVASPRKHISLDKLKRQDSKLEQQITAYLAQLDTTDQTDSNTDIDQQAVRQALQRLRHLQADNQSSQALMEELGLTQSVIGEPDAKKMRIHKGTLIGYNVQSAVDSFIVHHDGKSSTRRIFQPIIGGATCRSKAKICCGCRLLNGRTVRGEMALAVNAYNFKRAFKELGARRMMELLGRQGVR
jgi:hypothetical protein